MDGGGMDGWKVLPYRLTKNIGYPGWWMKIDLIRAPVNPNDPGHKQRRQIH